jgi:hypothetical protein
MEHDAVGFPVILSAAKDLAGRSDTDCAAGASSFAALRMTGAATG